MCEEAQWTLGFPEKDVKMKLALTERYGPATMQISLHIFTSLDFATPYNKADLAIKLWVLIMQENWLNWPHLLAGTWRVLCALHKARARFNKWWLIQFNWKQNESKNFSKVSQDGTQRTDIKYLLSALKRHVAWYLKARYYMPGKQWLA